ncbi:serine/threonine protein kinase [Labilithrix luteola]|uniref:Serine/threonine protein kinase n=1 Tax=Labilithrix luteola TaxID=1391654 RepID=A0A0K1QAT1_9BACT|nr:serine/threonine-protein kinase [Labilithrix luteola]AKV02530.1 serine/threonine protein kinase [Labilithrix luteola]
MAAKLARSQRTHARGSPTSAGSGQGVRSLLKVGDLLAGKYRVQRILGEGGMGVVVAAHHELLDQQVAVKLLYQDIADREAQSRLLLEARACAKLQSDHVARVVDVDTGADGLPFIVMELLDGADLCQIADARGALPRWLVVDYVLQALEGLAHAHVRGIVHRDLKPSNLFLANRADGTQIIKILDFGISKTNDGAPSGHERNHAAQLTGGRSVLGSPPYMSPEQVRSPKTVDHRTDIWSLGICMYELLTNSMPFGGEELQETFAQILEKQPVPIRHLVHGVPEGLEHVVMRCLAKRREERFNDVGELARALVPFGSGSWIKSADRVGATLSRGFEDISSATRLNLTGINQAMARTAIPSSPSRRGESNGPELTGTASTVARRFTMLETKSAWLIATPAILGIVIGGAALFRARVLAATEPAPPPPVQTVLELPADPSDETTSGATAVPVPTGIVTAPVFTAGPENEAATGPAPQGTVLAASAPSAPASAGTAKHATTAAPVRSATPSTKKSSSGSKPGLPAGLPRERQ